MIGLMFYQASSQQEVPSERSPDTEMRIVGILGAPHNKGNREQRIRISTYQKLCILQYMISDRLKFLFSVLCSFYCAKPFRIMPSAEQEQKESDGEVKSSERQSWQTKLSKLASLQANSGISRQLFPRYRRRYIVVYVFDNFASVCPLKKTSFIDSGNKVILPHPIEAILDDS